MASSIYQEWDNISDAQKPDLSNTGSIFQQWDAAFSPKEPSPEPVEESLLSKIGDAISGATKWAGKEASELTSPGALSALKFGGMESVRPLANLSDLASGKSPPTDLDLFRAKSRAGIEALLRGKTPEQRPSEIRAMPEEMVPARWKLDRWLEEHPVDPEFQEKHPLAANVLQGAAAAPATLGKYAAATALAGGNPVAGFALADAAEKSIEPHSKPGEVFNAALEGGVLGKGFGAAGKISKVLGPSVLMYGQAAGEKAYREGDIAKALTSPEALGAGIVGLGLTQTPRALKKLPFIRPAEKVTIPERVTTKALSPLIAAASQKYGIDPNLYSSLIKAESGGDATAVSEKGARGLTQIMPETAKQLGADLSTVEGQIDAGAKYLAYIRDNFTGDDPVRMVAAYNAGPGRLKGDAWMKFKETRDYVDRVMGDVVDKKAVDLQERGEETVKNQYQGILADALEEKGRTTVNEQLKTDLENEIARRIGEKTKAQIAQTGFEVRHPQDIEVPGIGNKATYDPKLAIWRRGENYVSNVKSLKADPFAYTPIVYPKLERPKGMPFGAVKRVFEIKKKDVKPYPEFFTSRKSVPIYNSNNKLIGSVDTQVNKQSTQSDVPFVQTRKIDTSDYESFNKKSRYPRPASSYIGNKGTMLDIGAYNDIVPENYEYKDLIEPFGGSGLLGNALTYNKKVNRTLNDLDPDVVNFHTAVKSNVKDITNRLLEFDDRVKDLQSKYPNGGEQAYSEANNLWNNYVLNSRTDIDRAVTFALKNNGSTGLFGNNQHLIAGVKRGYVWNIKKNSIPAITTELRSHSKLLNDQNVNITNIDARELLKQAPDGSLVPLNPPYVQQFGKEGNIVDYKTGKDLATLSGAISFIKDDMANAAKRGVNMIYTNNAHPEIIDALQSIGFKTKIVSVKSQTRGGARDTRDEVVGWFWGGRGEAETTRRGDTSRGIQESTGRMPVDISSGNGPGQVATSNETSRGISRITETQQDPIISTEVRLAQKSGLTDSELSQFVTDNVKDGVRYREIAQKVNDGKLTDDEGAAALKEAAGEPPSGSKPISTPEVEEFKSRAYERAQEEHPDIAKEDVVYKREHITNNIDKAVDLISTDREKAYRIAMGADKSEPVEQAMTNIVLRQKALDDGNHSLYIQLLKKGSMEQTKRGQAIAMEKASVTDNSPDRYVKELLQSQLEKLGKSYLSGLQEKLLKKTPMQKAQRIIEREASKVSSYIKDIKKMDTLEAQRLIDNLACK